MVKSLSFVLSGSTLKVIKFLDSKGLFLFLKINFDASEFCLDIWKVLATRWKSKTCKLELWIVN